MSFYLTVADIGARYGLHPTWKNFQGPVNFFLAEADSDECRHLRSRYKSSDNVKIFDIAISGTSGVMKFLKRVNPAMSGTLERLDVSPSFVGQREAEPVVREETLVRSITLNEFQVLAGEQFDFLKLDTEGNEFDILNNFSNLGNLLGIRCEVAFDQVFQSGLPNSFSPIHELLQRHGFILLNLDYDGRGDFYSKFLNSSSRYGVLQTSDAVWIKNPTMLLSADDGVAILKAALFLFYNNAPDLALHLLEKSHNNFSIENSKFGKLAFFNSLAVAKHFYGLKWIPGQNLNEHAGFYENIFQATYPRMNSFNENTFLNPLDV